ncbi:MAG TPA: hypothetical protein VGG37_02745, partial [Opitutaceae bacterium]
MNPGWRWLPTAWRLARLNGREGAPEWIPAEVPGAVQLDWARATGLPDFAHGSNARLYDGLEDFHWLYRTEVPEARPGASEELAFVCGGVDYAFEVRLGGRPVHAQEGMFTPFEVDVSGCAAGTALEILVRPAPKRPGAPPGRAEASASCKPAVSYGWDWHPRLIPLGIWRPARFCIRPRKRVGPVDFRYALAADLGAAEITVEAPQAPGCSWTLEEPSGRVALESSEPSARLERPRLWWCHDQGEPFLYTLVVRAAGGDVVRRKVGLRRVRLVMNEGGWRTGQGFPASRAYPPATIELNGRRIFAKGSNWVSSDVFPGRVRDDDLRALAGLAKRSNFNLLRCWGGAVVNPEAFFEACDEMGLLVWQEFPLACNDYPDDAGYLAVLGRES